MGRRPCLSAGEGVEKREKAERISDSVEAGMECSFARADWRGCLDVEAVGVLEVEEGARRLGGCGGGVSLGVWRGVDRKGSGRGEAGFTMARLLLV